MTAALAFARTRSGGESMTATRRRAGRGLRGAARQSRRGADRRSRRSPRTRGRQGPGARPGPAVLLGEAVGAVACHSSSVPGLLLLPMAAGRLPAGAGRALARASAARQTERNGRAAAVGSSGDDSPWTTRRVPPRRRADPTRDGENRIGAGAGRPPDAGACALLARGTGCVRSRQGLRRDRRERNRQRDSRREVWLLRPGTARRELRSSRAGSAARVGTRKRARRTRPRCSRSAAPCR